MSEPLDIEYAVPLRSSPPALSDCNSICYRSYTPTSSQIMYDVGRISLWVGFGIFLGGAIFFTLLSKRQAASARLFHILSTITLLTAAISYAVMVTEMGNVPVLIHTGNDWRIWSRMNEYRDLNVVRNVEAAITGPLVLLQLSLLGGIPYLVIAQLIVANTGMIATSLIAALTGGGFNGAKYTGLFFGMSCAFLAYMLYTILVTGLTYAKTQTPTRQTTYRSLSYLISALLISYPIVFLLGEGKSILSVDGVIIAQTVLDVGSKAVFGAWLIMATSGDEKDVPAIPASWTGSASTGRIALEDE